MYIYRQTHKHTHTQTHTQTYICMYICLTKYIYIYTSMCTLCQTHFIMYHIL